MHDKPSDVISERAVVAGILRHGGKAYVDIADILNSSCFVDEQHEIIYNICETILNDNPNTTIDVPIILAKANELGLNKSCQAFDSQAKMRYLRSLFNLDIDITNVRPQAQKLRKLLIARKLRTQLEIAGNNLEKIGGTESLMGIVAVAEKPLYDTINEVNSRDNSQITRLGDVVDDFLENIENNPDKSVGIPTGYDEYDEAIGGGHRPGKVHVFVARQKMGKSHLAANIALNINRQGYPTLLLDLELDEEDQLPRILANMSGVKINDIEKGKFVKDKLLNKKVKDAAKEFKEYEFYHIRVGGIPFDEILSVARRWITRYVGFNPDGTAKPCHIIYDYISVNDNKDLQNIQETQLLGIYMAKLEAFAGQYKVPIFVLGQTNRDGISSETTAIVAGSDRIGMKCASLAVLKPKSEEEISKDGVELGNKKIVVLATRFGPGHSFGEYIHVASNLSSGRFIECGSTSRPKKKKAEFEFDENVIEF